MARRPHRAFVVLMIATAAGVTACGGTVAPTAPTPITVTTPLASLAGVWTGKLRIDRCDSNKPPCFPSAGDLKSFELRIDGSYAAGVLFLDDSAAPWADLQCVRLPDASVQLSGRTTIGISGVVDVQQLAVRYDAEQGLAGTLQIAITSSSTMRTLTGTIASASQMAFPPTLSSSFSGTWTGRDERLDCAGDCDAVPPNHTTTIRLVQSGSTIVGDLGYSINGTIGDGAVDIRGAMEGASVRLAGISTFALDGGGTGASRVAIEDFVMRIDGLGRLIGDYRIVTDGVRNVRFVLTPFHAEERRRLVGVFRRF